MLLPIFLYELCIYECKYAKYHNDKEQQKSHCLNDIYAADFSDRFYI